MTNTHNNRRSFITTILANAFYAACFGVVLYVIGWHFWEAMYDPCAFQWHSVCY